MAKKFNPEQFKSDIKNAEKRLRKDVIQCQSCYKSTLDGITLSKCGRCGVAFYCSKECQKNAWPRHKHACKILQPPEVTNDPEALKALSDLRAFTAKVRPALMLWGFPAFNLKNDIKRGERDVLVVELRKRPDYKRTDLMFECVDAYIKAIDSFPREAIPTLRAHVDNCQRDSLAVGALAGVVMLLIDLTNSASNAVPFAFDARDESLFVDHPKPGPFWKQILMNQINTGKAIRSD